MRMREVQAIVFEVTRWLALASMIGIMAPTVWLSRAAAQEAITVSGEVIDVSCYLSQGSKGKRHKQCAELCAKKGLPIGVLTDAGDVYLLIEDHDAPEGYTAAKGLAGERVTVTGKKFAKGGVQSVLVADVKSE
ncbi:MAG: hypothetical protein SF182_15760 [Deltaproteobacteria bacterium]|nr:hypothetical protein [Deltaproteobacteria bacterium]